MNRRRFVSGLVGFAAPAIITPGVLMKIKAPPPIDLNNIKEYGLFQYTVVCDLRQTTFVYCDGRSISQITDREVTLYG